MFDETDETENFDTEDSAEDRPRRAPPALIEHHQYLPEWWPALHVIGFWLTIASSLTIAGASLIRPRPAHPPGRDGSATTTSITSITTTPQSQWTWTTTPPQPHTADLDAIPPLGAVGWRRETVAVGTPRGLCVVVLWTSDAGERRGSVHCEGDAYLGTLDAEPFRPWLAGQPTAPAPSIWRGGW